jgi:group I intron endonuclease
MIGIYKITNPLGQVYIGQSVNIEQRFRAYKKLRCRKQPKIYESLKIFGVKSHCFEIVIRCEIYQLDKFERYFQQLFNCLGDNGLNCKLTKDNPVNNYQKLVKRMFNKRR